MEKDFESFYNKCINENELNEIWEHTKQERRKKKNISIPLILIVDIILILWFTKLFGQFNHTFGIFPYLFIIAPILIIDAFILIIITIIFSKNNNIYNNMFKEKVINKIFQEFLTDVDYIPVKQMP